MSGALTTDASLGAGMSDSDGFLGIDHVPFNYRLRDARVRMGHSRRSLAVAIGAGPSDIGRYEALKKWPSKTMQGRIAGALLDEAAYLFPDEVALRLEGHTARTVTSILPIEAVSLDGPELRRLPAPDIFDDFLEADRRNRLHDQMGTAMESLTDREREVIRLRFGMDGAPLTLREVGLVQGVTAVRIQQVEAKALRKLRHPSRSRVLREFR